MNAHRAFASRLMSVGALALAALIGTSGATLADSGTGQTGNYLFKDNQNDRGVTCIYSGNSPYHLTKVKVAPPSLWWPDTSSSSNTQHGRVGWRAIVQASASYPSGPWHTVVMSAIQRATAYEDHPAYDPNDKAPLTKRTLSVPSGHNLDTIRVVVKGFWYRNNGSTLGTYAHEVNYYRYKTTNYTDLFNGGCPGSFTD